MRGWSDGRRGALGLALTPLLISLGCLSAITPLRGDAVERRPAQVESLSLAVLESFPLQVLVTLRGVLPDACARLESLDQRFEPDERTYHLSLTEARDAEAMCAQVISDFEITVPLVKAGLASGEFHVIAHTRSATFEIASLGDFPGLTLPSGGARVWTCMIEPRVCFAGPEEWSREEAEWVSPPFLSARLGLRFWPAGAEDPVRLLPASSEVHDRTSARLGWALGSRFLLSRDEGRIWSEHVFASCGDEGLCEFWVEAPSEPLLDAAGEPFWHLVRFSSRF